MSATGSPTRLDAPFANEPIVELRRAPLRARLADALAALDAELPLTVAVTIGGETRAPAGDAFASTDPGAPDRVVAVAAEARAEEVAAATTRAVEGGRRWALRPARERAEVLLVAAAGLRAQRARLAALALRECGKPWPEADADVCEAIDFLEYYARGAVALDAGAALLQPPGERNVLRYAPRGVVAVIAPWNFPLAIVTGMTAAALATGNAAVVKPAEQSPACAAAVVAALHAAGVPPDALALLPGAGAVGAALVRDPRVATIAFTGSLAVGLEIQRAAAETGPGQRALKRVVAELGGKNCAIVDADADLDEAVPAIVASAFGYGGQKCSAVARVLVHEAVAEPLCRRLAGAVAVLSVGQPQLLETEVGPLIERAAQERVERATARAAAEGRLLLRHAGPLPATGWFCPPAVATELPPDSPLLRDELFGPLLTVEPVRDVAHACALVDALPYALTGAIFCRDPATVAAVAATTPVGNLYVNRATTGAMVGRQPFGGNRLSGTGAKAGGPDYLRHFAEPRVVTENTVRHGLVA